MASRHFSVRASAQIRRGAVAIEFILVSLMLVLTFVSIIEISRMLMVQQVLVNAAREGVRRAVVPNSTDAELTGADGVLTHYVESAGIPATYDVDVYVNGTLSDVDSALPHDEIRVQLTVPYADVSWGFLRFAPGNGTLTAGVVMRKE
jgi:Flp pilus assembly protein TadG